MRVLLLAEACSAGVGRHVMDLGRGLLDAGLQVRLIYAPGRMDARFADELTSLPALARTSVVMHRGPNWSDLEARAAIRACLLSHGPFDVVHAHSSKAGFLAASLSSRQAPPRIYTPHSPLSMSPALGKWARLAVVAVERRIYRRMDAVVAVSREESDHLLGLGVPRQRLHLVANGIAAPDLPSRQEVRADLGLAGDAAVVGFVGRLVEQKNPLLLVHAFARVRRQLPKARLVLVGDGPLLPRVQAAAASLGVTESVMVLGHQDGQRTMPAFDVLALPSRYEGMPYVLIEALAAGLPIVATPVGGTGQTLRDGDNGVLCRESTPECLASALLAALVPTAQQRMATASRRLARHFTRTAMCTATIDVYRAVTAAAPAVNEVRGS